MLDYATRQRTDVMKRIGQLQAELLRLQGAKAALDDVIEQARTSKGQAMAPAPPPPPPAPAPVAAQPMTALRIGVGPIQAENELRE